MLAWTVAVAVDRNDRDVFPAVLPAAPVAAVLIWRRRRGWAFAMTAVATVSLVATIFTGLYPRVLVSDPVFANSLTIESTASTHYTLTALTIVAALLLPVFILSQAWGLRRVPRPPPRGGDPQPGQGVRPAGGEPAGRVAPSAPANESEIPSAAVATIRPPAANPRSISS